MLPRSRSEHRDPMATGLVAALTVALLGRAAQRPGVRRQPGHPGQLHGLGFDQCEAPEPVGDVDLDQEVAVPRGRHLHLRQLPRLPAPDQPDRRPGCATSSPPAGTCCRSRSARRRRARTRYPRYGKNIDPTINPSTHRTPTPRPAPRAAPRRSKAVDTAQRLGIVRGQHALLRPRGLRHPPQHGVHAPRRCGSSRAGPASCTRSGYASGFYSSAASGIRMLDDARVAPGNPITLPDQIWIADWNGKANTSSSLHPQRRVAALQPAQAVPGRPQRDLGRRDDQHRPQLPRPAHAEDPRRRALRHRPRHRPRRRSTPAPRPRDPRCTPATISAATTRPINHEREHRARSCRCSACSSSSASTATRSPGRGTRQTRRRCTPSRQRRVSRDRRRRHASACGRPCSPRGNSRTAAQVGMTSADVDPGAARAERRDRPAGSRVDGTYGAVTATRRDAPTSAAVGLAGRPARSRAATWAALEAGRR